MLSEALSHMLDTLGSFLPQSIGDLPAPDVTVVRLQERQIGLGRFHGLEERHFFPVVHRGIRIAGTVRFQLWGGPDGPELVSQQVRDLTEAILDERETLDAEGFVELSLASVSTADHVAVIPAWRQTAEFDVLYEFRQETHDLAGGLIARLPTELAEEWGAMLVTADVTIWNSDGTAPLALKGRRSVHGLSTLEFLQSAVPAGAVVVRRTRTGASGPPDDFATLDAFLTAVAGPTPDSTHARTTFSSLAVFLAALGAAGDPITFVDEMDQPREFNARGRLFDPPIELGRASDVFDVTFEAPALGADHVLYLRASRGRTPSP
jgi:hypothetical protein